MRFVMIPHHGVGHVVVDTTAQAIEGAIVELTNGFAWRPFEAGRARLGDAVEGRFASLGDAWGAFLAEAGQEAPRSP